MDLISLWKKPKPTCDLEPANIIKSRPFLRGADAALGNLYGLAFMAIGDLFIKNGVDTAAQVAAGLEGIGGDEGKGGAM